MPDSAKYVLVGGGVVSAWAAQNIRERDADGRIVIVGEELHPPYDKPPLSKTYIAKDDVPADDAYTKFDNFYPDNKIDLVRGTRAVRVDRQARTVHLDNGDTLSYEKLLLATGAEPRPLNVPGSDLLNIHYLRAIEDAQHINAAARRSDRAVLVGAGYLNMEVASGLIEHGLDITIVEVANRPWSRLASAPLGDFLTGRYSAKGARFVFNDSVSTFTGDGDRVTGVVTHSGMRLDADFVMVSIGVNQRTQLAADAGLEVDPAQGVVVDEYLQTSDPNIWAAGDIACFNDIAIGRRWHAEHHLNAKWQGRAVGAIMAGERKPYNQIPYFFSDFLDLHMIMRGDPAGSSRRPSTILGDLPGGEFVEVMGDEEGRLRMGLAISHDEKKLDTPSDKLEELIRAGAPVSGLNAGTFGF